jgi:hypothetical protein
MAPESVAAVNPPAVKADKRSRNARLVIESIFCFYSARKLVAESSISFRSRCLALARFTCAVILRPALAGEIVAELSPLRWPARQQFTITKRRLFGLALLWFCLVAFNPTVSLRRSNPISIWSLFVRFPRMSRICFLARLRAAKHPTFEFAFRLEPIVQITAWLFAAFEIDLVCATSDFLITRRVPY